MNPFPAMKPGDELHLAQMTPEIRERIKKASSELIDWLVKNTKTPLEAMMVLDLVRDGLMQQFGIRVSTYVSADDLEGRAGMNRIERRDARLEIIQAFYSEPNYSAIDFFFDQNRRTVFRRWLRNSLLIALAGCVVGVLIHLHGGRLR